MPVLAAAGMLTGDVVGFFVLWLILLSFAYFYLIHKLFDSATQSAMKLIILAMAVPMVGLIYLGQMMSNPGNVGQVSQLLSYSFTLTGFFFALLGFAKIKIMHEAQGKKPGVTAGLPPRRGTRRPR